VLKQQQLPKSRRAEEFVCCATPLHPLEELKPPAQCAVKHGYEGKEVVGSGQGNGETMVVSE